MKKRSRAEELNLQIRKRLDELDSLLLLPPAELNDEEFETLRKEAIRLRETLKLLE